MIVIGLTGSIGMGKSTVAQMFADEDIPVWDADSAVHRLYAHDSALKSQIMQAFGDVFDEEGIDRAKLSKILADDATKFQTLNALVHPAVAKDREAFVALNRAKGIAIVLCDIPLLFETNAQTQFDVVIVVTAPKHIQKQRVMLRPHMTEEKFKLILARQMPDDEKRKRADYLIDTARSFDDCRQTVREIIADIIQKRFTNPT
jgi:dephospho-CoA kinase